MRKGISPLIAEVLLIGFTVAVASLVILWATGFTRTTTSKIGSQAEIQAVCMNAGIDFFGTVIYNTSSQILSGYVKNTGNVPLGNISFQVIYSTSISNFPNQISELLPQNIQYFSLSGITPNFNTLYVSTNCTNPPATAKIDYNQINVVS